MYVHDAIFGHSSLVEEPIIATTSNGCRVVLPSSTTTPEKVCVSNLFDRLFAYIRSVNRYVQVCVCAAEELRGMSSEQVSHMVLMIQCHNNSIRGQLPVCLLWMLDSTVCCVACQSCVSFCPHTIGAEERSVLLINVCGEGLTEIKIDHAAYDALYHILIHPTGDGGWEDNMPKRTVAHAAGQLGVTNNE